MSARCLLLLSRGRLLNRRHPLSCASHSPFRNPRAMDSLRFVRHSVAPLPTRLSGLRSSSALRSAFVPASLYKLAYRLGLACNVPASSVGTPSVTLSLKSFSIGFLLSPCWLLRPPETPSRLLASLATFLVGGSPPAVLGSPLFPLAAALGCSRSFLLPSVAQTRTNTLACVFPLHRRTHNRGRPRPLLRFGALGLPPHRGARGGSRWIAAPCYPILPSPFRNTTFLNFFYFFQIPSFRSFSYCKEIDFFGLFLTNFYDFSIS